MSTPQQQTHARQTRTQVLSKAPVCGGNVCVNPPVEVGSVFGGVIDEFVNIPPIGVWKFTDDVKKPTTDTNTSALYTASRARVLEALRENDDWNTDAPPTPECGELFGLSSSFSSARVVSGKEEYTNITDVWNTPMPAQLNETETRGVRPYAA